MLIKLTSTGTQRATMFVQSTKKAGKLLYS